MSSDSTPKRRRRKSNRPDKPKGYKDFPLYAHPAGYWAKKIRGKLHYFGRWGRTVNGRMERLPGDGWQQALELYNEQRDDLFAGRTPRVSNKDGLILGELCDRFLNSKRLKLKSDELSLRSYQEYKQTTDRLDSQFGGKRRLVADLAAYDFERLRAAIAETCGPVRLGNEITRVKSVFKYALDNGLIGREVRFGSEFKKPDKSKMRKHRHTGGKKLFTVDELRTLLAAADPLMKAAALLGVNAGLGNSDIGNLQLKHLDLKAGWLDYPRGKTGIARRVPLWSETMAALQTVIAARPEPKDKADSDCVFLTPRRNGDVRGGGVRLVTLGETSHTDYVAREFGKLLRTLKINGRRGLGFYSLRHTLATVGLQTGDRDAVKSIMGHAESDVLAAYDETGPNDERLVKVVAHVHAWLFGEGDAK